jgi:hypothetical protein
LDCGLFGVGCGAVFGAAEAADGVGVFVGGSGVSGEAVSGGRSDCVADVSGVGVEGGADFAGLGFLALADGEVGELAFEGGVKSEDDVLFGDASIDEFEGDAAFGSVVLDPDFVVADI